MTIEHVGCSAGIAVIDKSSEGSAFDTILEVIEEHQDKLLDILLHYDIHFLSVGLICNAKSEGVDFHSSCLLQVCEYPLHLMEEIVIDLPLFGNHHFGLLLVIDPQKKVPETFISI